MLGVNLPADQRECVERLRKQVFQVQERFNLAEQSALLLEEMLSSDSGLSEAVGDTYEAHAFVALRYQLFRVLIIDLGAAVLDRDSRSASVHTLVKKLQNDASVLTSLKNYYADPTCIEASVQDPTLSAQDISAAEARHIQGVAQEIESGIDATWVEVNGDSGKLESDDAERIKWARNKVVAHFDRSSDGLLSFADHPNTGSGPIVWNEPISFLKQIRPYVYKVFRLITDTSWTDSVFDSQGFYAEAFWDRFKNGQSSLRPAEET